MEKFHLEEPSIKRKKEAIEYIKEHIKYNSNINGSGGLDSKYENYEEWLKYLELNKNPDTCSEGKCPGVEYFLIRESDDKLIGMINLRWNLTKDMLQHGGNIGYGIIPTERRKGYAKIQLYLCLLKAKELGLDKVLLTAYDNNIGSVKTILALGGVLENKVEDNLGRYWINVEDSINKNKDIYKGE